MIIFSSDPYFELINKSLNESGFGIDALITQPPKPRGRSLRVLKNSAQIIAEKENIKVLSPDPLNKEFIKELARLKPEIGILYAYGKILPSEILDIFDRGILNLHPSLLPKYRGPSPIQSAILDNKLETGYSIIKLTPRMDAGDIIFQEKIKIGPNDTFASLKEKIIIQASQKLPGVLREYLKGQIDPEKQSGKVTYCKMIKKTDGDITPRDTAKSAYGKYRAFVEWPGTRIITSKMPIIIKEAKYTRKKIKLIKVQVPGKKAITFDAFKNGYSELLTELPDFVII